MQQIPEHIYDLILEHLSGTIDKSGLDVLKDWLDADPQHPEEWKEICSLWESGIIGTRMKDANMEEVWRSLTARFHKQQRIKRVRRLSAIAASILLLLGIFLLYPAKQTQDDPGHLTMEQPTEKVLLILPNGETVVLDPTLETGQQTLYAKVDSQGIVYTEASDSTETSSGWHELIVPRKECFRLTLADGSRVMLNAASSIRYPARFDGPTREVYLSGEAYFEIMPNPASPFIVRTDHTTTRVLGTEFNVMAYSQELTTQITLIKGKVEVDIKEQQQQLRPDQQLQLTKQSMDVALRDVDAQEVASWITSTFRFEDIPLEQLFHRLERWYDISFEFRQNSLKERKFTGGFRKDEPLEKVLEMISQVNDVQFEIEDNKTINRIIIMQK